MLRFSRSLLRVLTGAIGILLFLLMGWSVHGYVEAPMSLGAVIAASTNILTMRVEKVDKERNLIIFRKEKDLKGVHPTEIIKHNIGRGGLVDEDALCDALEAGRLAGAGLDVFEGEPRVNPRLLAQRRVVLTPHIGSASRPTRLAMAMLAADNLIGVLSGGGPRTPLNPEVLPRPAPADR